MQIRQGNALQSLRGVQAFLDAHAARLGTAATSGARQKLDAQLQELDVHATKQTGSDLAARGATQTQYALRQALRHEHMAPIARIAVAELPPSPALRPLRLPSNSLSTETLHAAAMGMADAAEPYAAVFVAAGLAPDFIAQLRAAATALRVPIDLRTENRGSRSGATEGLSNEVRNARRTVRVLDALVSVALKDDPALLTNWNAVKRPPAKTGKLARGTTPPVTTTPPATPAPAPAPTPALIAAPAAP